MDVSVIIVSYNTKDMTLACIQSVYEETKKATFEILVVDNDSKDSSSKAIKESFPDLTLYALKENLGFAKANNFASEYAKGDYILLLNPDTVILDSAIDNLILFAKKTPRACFMEGARFMAI